MPVSITRIVTVERNSISVCQVDVRAVEGTLQKKITFLQFQEISACISV